MEFGFCNRGGQAEAIRWREIKSLAWFSNCSTINKCLIIFADTKRDLLGYTDICQPAVNVQRIQQMSNLIHKCYVADFIHDDFLLFPLDEPFLCALN